MRTLEFVGGCRLISSSLVQPASNQGITSTTSLRYIPFFGRLLIGVPFAMSGLSKLAAIGATLALIQAVGLPPPPLALVVSVLVEVGGGSF